MMKGKRSIICAIFRNMQQIFSLPGTSIDRIRDANRNSKYGLSSDLIDVLSDIYRDDVMQPKPSTMLKLQNDKIQQWLNDVKFAKDTTIHMRLLDFMIQTNEKMINDWIKLNETQETKWVVIWWDIARFELQVKQFHAKKPDPIQPIQVSDDAWKELLLSQKFDESYFNLAKIKECYPYKAIGLFKMYK